MMSATEIDDMILWLNRGQKLSGREQKAICDQAKAALELRALLAWFVQDKEMLVRSYGYDPKDYDSIKDAQTLLQRYEV